MEDRWTTFVCIGGAHIDHKATALTPILLHTSVPVKTESAFGGTVRNIAEHLAALGQRVAIVSRVGQDADGDSVLRDCEHLGIDVSGVSRSPDERSAWCSFLLTPDNEMFIGLASTTIYDGLTPDLVLQAIPPAGRSVWVMDTSLPSATIKAIANAASADVTLAATSASYAKTPRLISALGRIDFLFVNKQEAEVISGLKITQGRDVERVAREILAKGAKNVVITLGSAGAFVLSQATAVYLPAERLTDMDTIGAGDALVAGFLVGFNETASIDCSLRWGMVASAFAIKHLAGAKRGLEASQLARFAGSLTSAHAVPDSVEIQ
jgi:pseudouridine kinase